MNVVFLDYDGVVNTPMLGDDGIECCCYPDDNKVNNVQAVQLVSDFCLKYDYSIVVSSQAILYNLPETPKEYNPFAMPSSDERIALYHTESIVFRVSVLWDLLAQLCNVIYHTGLEPTVIHYNRYFANHVSGEKSFAIAEEINNYLKETDDGPGTTHI